MNPGIRQSQKFSSDIQPLRITTTSINNLFNNKLPRHICDNITTYLSRNNTSNSNYSFIYDSYYNYYENDDDMYGNDDDMYGFY